jgi:FAD/FMN-containing dehydrogenase
MSRTNGNQQRREAGPGAVEAAPAADGHVDGSTTPSAQAGVVRRLKAELGHDQVSDDRAALHAVSRDFLRAGRAGPRELPPPQLPLAVVLPQSTEEVAAAVRIAAAARVPIVEFGGGTGLMGGARTVRPGIVLDLRSLNRVLEVSVEDRSVRVQAGSVLADVGAALEPHGLIFGHDPWTVPIATVGGTISTNGLGYLGGRYGSMGDQVLGLTVVLPDGTIVRTRPLPRSSTGPRLKQLFAGAEGTLGVITEAVLRAFPRPEARKLLGYSFAGFNEGYRAIQALFAAGITPAMVDYGQTYGGNRYVATPVSPTGIPSLLYLAFDGLKEEVRALAGRTRKLLEAQGGTRLPARQTRRFWEQRHVIAEEIRARQQRGEERDDWPGPDMLFDYVHVALPASAVLPFKQRSQPLLLHRGISIGEWGLWNQPELFSIGLFRRMRSEEDRRSFADGIDEVLKLAQDMGGSMEYVHGAGLRLAHLMDREHGAGLDLLRSLKRCIDPNDLLNPGKLGL